MKVSIFLFFTFLLSTSALDQGGQPIPPGVRQAGKAEVQFEKDVPPPRFQRAPTDMAKLERDADELATLAQSIPLDLQRVKNGTLPKDVLQKLKQIEKLSKTLRSQLNP